MNRLITSYNYKIEMSLVVNNNEYDVNPGDISSVTINSEYDKNTMPIIYIGLSLDLWLYDEFVKHSSDGFVVFKIYKFDAKSTSYLETSYIEDKFMYVMTDNPNYNQSLQKQSTETYESTATYMEGYISLISLQSINDNKRLFNTIFKNTDLLSIIHHVTNHMKMCIEPFDDNPKISQFIIPPITSLTNLLQYINNYYCFYSTKYRYFRDFNMTYLLSSKGISTKIINDNKYNTIIINICDPLEIVGNANGIEINRDSKSYIINVNANDTSLDIDRLTDKTFNSIIGVDTNGNILKVSLNIPRNTDSTEKVILERVFGDNLNHIYNSKNIIESSSIVATIYKSEIDTTIITPNKEFLINHYDSNSEYNGRYILSFKKEIMHQQSTNYIGIVIFGLRKVGDIE